MPKLQTLELVGRSWDAIASDVSNLSLRALRQLYRTYRELEAKSAQDTRLEYLLEAELARRGKL